MEAYIASTLSTIQSTAGAATDRGDIPTQRSFPPEGTAGGRTITPSASLLLPGLMVAALMLVFVRWAEARKSSPSGRASGMKRCQQSPCTNCRFFQNNFYLKCAVHPHKVMSTEAKDCPDYWPKDSNSFPQ